MRKKVILYILFALLSVSCFFGRTVTVPQPPVIRGSHEIEDDSSILTPLWGENNLVTWKSYEQVPIILLENHLVLIDYTKDNVSPVLKGYEIDTGELAWETTLPNRAGNSSYVVKNNSIIIGAGKSLLSYDGETGFLNWENQELPAGKIYAMQVVDDKLLAYYDEAYLDSSTQVVYSLNIFTGELFEIRKIADVDNLYFMIENVGYWENLKTIVSTDISTSKILWQTTFDTFKATIEGIHDETIFVRDREDRTLYAVNLHDGGIRWQYNQNLMSNSVVTGNNVLVFIEGEELVQLDLLSGEKKGSTLFSDTNNTVTEDKYNYVAASDNIIAIYFADTLQLGVFRLNQ